MILQNEYSLIDSLINEDEKNIQDIIQGEIEDLGSWTKYKSPKPALKKIPKASPILPPISISQTSDLKSISKIQRYSNIEKSLNLGKKKPISYQLKLKVHKNLTITEPKLDENLVVTIKDLPSKTRFKYSSPIKLKTVKLSKKRYKTPMPIGSDLPNPLHFQKDFQKSIIYPKEFYEKFFIKSGSNKTIRHKSHLPERIIKKYNLSEENSERIMRTREKKKEKEKITKKFLINPILENISKYSHVLK